VVRQINQFIVRDEFIDCLIGYSWKTNQYGLAVDNVLAFQLVKPDGQVIVVTKFSDSELFFGLKGGFNNFVRAVTYTLGDVKANSS
jgi:FAD/FMN-containing dehydrogenase